MKFKNIIFLSLLAILITGCSLGTKEAEPLINIETITTVPTASVTPSPVETTQAATSTPSPKPTITEIPIENYPVDVLSTEILKLYTFSEKMYNFINKMPVLSTENSSYVFDYIGNITINTFGSDTPVTVTVEEMLAKSGISSDIFSSGIPSENCWFYNGSIYLNGTVYAAYDYIGSSAYSVLLGIDPLDNSADIIVMKPYRIDESFNTYTFCNNRIYYTDILTENGKSVHSFISCDSAGNDVKTEFTQPDNGTVFSMYPDSNCIYYLSETDSNNVSLYCYNLNDSTYTLIKNSLSAEFLYIYNNYALLNISDSGKLIYLDLTSLIQDAINITTNEDIDINIGFPIFCAGRLLLPLYPASTNVPGSINVAVIDFNAENIVSHTEYTDEYGYIVGVIGSELFYQNSSGFHYIDVK